MNVSFRKRSVSKKKYLKMDKRGFLLGEETLKIILAVISIVFLVGFLGALYYNSVKDDNLELAKASLEHLVEELNAGVTEVEIYNPKGWYVMNYLGDLCICKKNDMCDNPDETCAESDVRANGKIRIMNPPITLELKEGVLYLK